MDQLSISEYTGNYKKVGLQNARKTSKLVIKSSDHRQYLTITCFYIRYVLKCVPLVFTAKPCANTCTYMHVPTWSSLGTSPTYQVGDRLRDTVSDLRLDRWAGTETNLEYRTMGAHIRTTSFSLKSSRGFR